MFGLSVWHIVILLVIGFLLFGGRLSDLMGAAGKSVRKRRAHDLKNPLGVILGRTEMLTEMVSGAASSVDNIKSQIVHIRSAANRVTEIINSLISDAMADAHDITIKREPVDLVALLRELVEANQPLAARKDQTIVLSAPATLGSLCDSDRMREAIDNLLSNAIKYSPIGGHIEVGVDHRGDRTVIRVTDEGPGLSPEDTARLFGRFQRLSASDRRGNLDRTRPVHREADRRPARRHRRGGHHRPERHHLHDRDPGWMSPFA